MANKTNYEDNFFFFSTLIRDLSVGIKLDIDAEIFRDKIIEDVLFIDNGLMRLYGELQENKRLIRRMDYLRALLRTEHVFIDFLESAMDHGTAFAEQLEPYKNKLVAAKREHGNISHEIVQTLQSTEPGDDEDQVSQEEISHLLEPYNEGEDA